MAQEQLTFLLNKYKDNEKALRKIDEYMTTKLPQHLSIYLGKELRKEILEIEMEKYINAFFTEPATQFYFIPVSNTFVQYDGKHYQVLNEDIIWHTILSDITAKGVLLDWKYLVKTKILKGIKERVLFSAIPESETIQSVIGFLTPGYFTSKEETKYFLACLGDNILKRSSRTIQLTTPSAIGFVDSIQQQAQYIFTKTITINDSFCISHSNKTTKQRRLVRINIAEELNEYWHNFLKTSILDLLVVSCHYSTRFGGSENYIQSHCHNSEVKEYTLYLKDKSNDSLIADFINAYIVKGNAQTDTSMTWEDLYFLWNEYLKTFHYPELIPRVKWEETLVKHLVYDSKLAKFPNISSKYLQYVRIFNLFWRETITDASDTQFEIDEITMLYNDWLMSRQPGEKFLSEKKILSVIQYFYPDYNIVNSKYIPNIACSLWNKNQDIETTLQYLKEWEIVGKESNLTSFYKLYELYCSHGQKKSLKYIVSKKYFENRLRATIPKNYLSGDAVLADYWKL